MEQWGGYVNVDKTDLKRAIAQLVRAVRYMELRRTAEMDWVDDVYDDIASALQSLGAGDESSWVSELSSKKR
jgi:hypothetical protein